MIKKPFVSIIIPTRNSARFLEATLKSIISQRYKPFEILIIDTKSTDQMPKLAKKYGAKVIQFKRKLEPGTFDAPHKRNLGVKLAKGKYVYCVDADMVLPRGLLTEAVELGEKGFDALIVPEESIGEGIWSRAKTLERRCYWGDDLIESPRFFRKSSWDEVGGVDESLVAGRDDGDLHQRLIENGYKIGRTKNIILHNEGRLTLQNLYKKKIMYGKDVLTYIKKRPVIGILSYSPIKSGYFKNWKLFLKNPIDTIAFIIINLVEAAGGATGVIISLSDKLRKKYNSESVKIKIFKLYNKIPHGYIRSILKNIISYILSKQSKIETITFNGIKFKIYENPLISNSRLLKDIKGYYLNYQLKKGDTVVDAGAYNGLTTVYIALKVGPKGRVIAIEPDPYVRNMLNANIKLNNLTNVTVIPKGVFGKASVMKFDVQGIGSRLQLFNQNIPTINSVKVDSLDNILLKELKLKKVDFIQMDIEGAEIAALKGALKVIKSNPEIHLAIASYHIVNGRQTYKSLEQICKKNKLKSETKNNFHLTTFIDKN